MADAFVVRKLEEWDLQHAIPIFKAQKITQSVFKLLSRTDIDKMLFTIGEQLTFMSHFEDYLKETQKPMTIPSTSYNGSIWQGQQDGGYHDDLDCSLTQHAAEQAYPLHPTVPAEQVFLPETEEEETPLKKRPKYLTWTLFELLESSLEGKLILAFHKKNQMLDGSMQKKLTYIVVSQLMETFNNSVPNTVFETLSNEISEMFNGELKQTWFSPSAGSGSQQLYARGKLMDHYCNRRKMYVQYGIFERKRGQKMSAQNLASETNGAHFVGSLDDSSNLGQHLTSNGSHIDPLHQGSQPSRPQPQRKNKRGKYIQ